MLDLALKSGLKIAVAHQMRLAPSILHLKKLIEDGALGELIEVRAHGKQDSRAGGEDMIVLGTHLFHLMGFLLGDSLWVTARIRQGGREATLKDARQPSENIGAVLGDEIEAQFAFPEGVNARFTSRGKFRQTAGHWGFELVGSKAVVRVLANAYPDVYILSRGEWKPDGNSDQWRRPDGDPTSGLAPDERAFRGANRRVAADWLKAIRQQAEPACSGLSGLKAVEMCLAVFAAGLSGGRVHLPMKNRQHPLEAQS
jgi:predicted dehydrogenase